MKMTKIFKWLATIMFFWAFFPFVVTADVVILNHVSAARIGLELLAVTLVGLAGCGVSAAGESFCPKGTKGIRLIAFHALRYGGAAILCAAVLILFAAPSAYMPTPLVSAVPLAIAAMISYFMGQVFFFRPYYDILKRSAVLLEIIGGVVLAATGWVLEYNEIQYSYPIDVLVVQLLIFISVYGIIKSQGTLDEVMDRRGHKMSALPSNIRKYNLILVAVLIFALALMFFLRGPLGAFLSMVQEGIFFIGQTLFTLFAMLLAFVPTSTQEAGQNQMTRPDMSEFGVVENHIPDLSAVLIIFALIVAVLFLWKRIIAVIRKVVKMIRNAWRALFHTGRKGRIKDEDADYVDEEESLTDEERSYNTGVSTWKAWRKAYKQFNKTDNPAEKLRRGYRLMVEWLYLKGVSIEASDTPLEILEKSEERLSRSETDGITQSYNALRYGEQEADRGKVQDLIRILKQLEGEARPAKGEKKAQRDAAKAMAH